jgi:hypothetical protein
MCIAFDGAYILEAPPADPASTDEHRPVSARDHPLDSADRVPANVKAERPDDTVLVS